MSKNLWSANHPSCFWQCQPELPEAVWEEACRRALPVLELAVPPADVDGVLAQVLGEGRFGPDHWQLSKARRLYYLLKPLLPRSLTRFMRRFLTQRHASDSPLGFPIEPRYVGYLYACLRHALTLSGQRAAHFRALWPEGRAFGFVLTHDVEGPKGLTFVLKMAELEESLGFRSAINFVPAGYKTDPGLLAELRKRGFEIGVHGYRHDGKLFNSRAGFMAQAVKINQALKDNQAVGFCSPLTHRNPEWMQALDLEYELSFFDTDPFEPMPGGTMSIYPFQVGRFIELPYTLVQDYTLTSVLGETSPALWLEKVEFIARHHGLARVNSHPDYLRIPENYAIYRDFLLGVKQRGDYWHALPRQAADWWRRRSDTAETWTASVDADTDFGLKIELSSEDAAVGEERRQLSG